MASTTTTTTILITGANSGVGYATTKVLTHASASYHVIMAGRSLPKLDKARTEIEATSPAGKMSTLELDVDDEISIKRAAEKVASDFGRIDVLINNAATGFASPDIKAQFEAHLRTNVLGPKLVSTHFRELLLKSKNPYSIYVSSGVGSFGVWERMPEIPMPDNAEAYIISKSALNMIMLQEHIESVKGKLGRKSFAVCPGFVKSQLRGPKYVDQLHGVEAGDPEVSGQTLLRIIRGERDDEVGKYLHKDGVYPW